MKVQCIDCMHSGRPKVSALSDAHMLRAGFAVCAAKAEKPGHWIAVLWPRACEKFVKSPEAAKRREWLGAAE